MYFFMIDRLKCLVDDANFGLLTVISKHPDKANFPVAIVLPKRRPDRRTPLWQQRQRAADLLGTARDYPDFPILLETVRECINDVFDLPALRQVLGEQG